MTIHFLCLQNTECYCIPDSKGPIKQDVCLYGTAKVHYHRNQCAFNRLFVALFACSLKVLNMYLGSHFLNLGP